MILRLGRLGLVISRHQKDAEECIVGPYPTHKMGDNQKPLKEKDNCLKHSIREEYISSLVQVHGTRVPCQTSRLEKSQHTEVIACSTSLSLSGLLFCWDCSQNEGRGTGHDPMEISPALASPREGLSPLFVVTAF